MEKVPLGQIGHVERATAEYVPAAQIVHEPEAELAEIDPNGHGVHWDEPAAEKYPAGHTTHVADDVAPTAVETVPPAQGKQVAVDEAPTLVE